MSFEGARARVAAATGMAGGGVTTGEVDAAIAAAIAALDVPTDVSDLTDTTGIIPPDPAAIDVPFVIPFILDGGGSAISTGVWYDTGILINFAATVTGWVVDGDDDIVVTVQRAANATPSTYAAISGTEKPTLSGVTTNSDTSLTTWTTALASLDRLRVSVDSSDATFATISLLCTREVGP